MVGKEVLMGYSKEALAEKLIEMYPEITRHNLQMSLEFSDEKNAWIVELKKGEHELTTHLEKQDADECMNGIKCVYLGVQTGRFVQHFEEDETKLKTS